ncbi:MAG: DEAD/DEAH box helicase [Bacteroidetes bacterium]|nr:DEAD/DEAH box helicase [Bacteroidota bacterium]
MTFEELLIAPEICRAILELGFENPMPVQEQVIPLLLNKKNDIIALAQTGTGKTAAFGIPVIQDADSDNPLPQALILCPTRELCLQISGDLNDFAKYLDGIKILAVYGGSSIDTQIRSIKKGVQIIVATPGRLMDLIERKAIKLSQVQKVVLDEADEMLNMGFLDDINTILAQVPKERSIMLFSATMPNSISSITHKYMNNPIEVTVGSRNAGAENVKHVCYTVQAKDKYLALKRIADYIPGIYGIVFCRTRKETQEIADKLIQDGYNADALHGDLSQMQRDSVMQKFRIRNISILVATDVAARGLDVDDLTHVINYSLPDDYDLYTHRSGRTGRTGKAGISVVIVNLREKHALQIIEKKIKKTFIHAKVPSGREICEKQLFHFVDKMEKVEVAHEQIDSYLPVIFRKLEWLDKEEVIKRFVSLEFNRFLDYYKNAVDINASSEKRESGKNSERSRDRGSSVGFSRLFINMGKMDGMFASQLIDLINSNTRGLKVEIGRIDLLKSFSFFEIESQYEEQVIKALNDETFSGRQVIVEKATEKPKDESSDKKPEGDRGYRKSNGYSSRSKEGGASRSRDGGSSRSRDGGSSRSKDGGSSRNKEGGASRSSGDGYNKSSGGGFGRSRDGQQGKDKGPRNDRERRRF